MVPNDQQRTNSFVNDTLVVGQSISTPLMKTHDLVVTGTSTFQDIKIQGTTDTLTVTTMNGTTGNFGTLNATNITTTNLTVTAGITTVDLTAMDVVATSVTTVNLLANDIKTNTFRASNALLTDTLNQLVMGTGQTITLSAPTPATSHIYTLPDVLNDASFILSEGNQTINGIKTFTTAPVFPGGLAFSVLTLTNTSNQLTMGTGQTITINAPTPAASRVYTTPDVLANANFIMSEGTQTINGAKTFSTQITITPTTNQLVLGITQTITVTAPTPAVSRVYTMQDVLADASFIMSEGTQTINGTKTFTNAPVFPALSFASLTLTNTTNQLVLGTTNTTTISSVAPAASRTYTIQDALTNANFIMSEGIQTVNGAKTFSTQIVINPTTNQLVLGTTNTTTITSVAPAASRTYTIPDAGGAASFVMTESAQTIAGTKTFSAAVVINPTTNQLVLGVTNTTTISSVAPAASRTYTIPDAGADTSFVMAAGTQTVGGAKTFSTAVTINPTTNQLVLGVTNTTTINSVAPAASRTYTIPDAGAAASFVMTESAQTINGTKTFGGNILLPTSGGTASNFNYYEELNTTLAFTGNFAGTQTPNVKYTRVGRMVTISMDSFTVAANATGGINSAAIPTRFRPSVNVSFISPVRNNSVTTAGGVTLTSGGVFAFNRLDLTTGNFFQTFQNTNNVGIIDNAFTWQTT